MFDTITLQSGNTFTKVVEGANYALFTPDGSATIQTMLPDLEEMRARGYRLVQFFPPNAAGIVYACFEKVIP